MEGGGGGVRRGAMGCVLARFASVYRVCIAIMCIASKETPIHLQRSSLRERTIKLHTHFPAMYIYIIYHCCCVALSYNRQQALPGTLYLVRCKVCASVRSLCWCYVSFANRKRGVRMTAVVPAAPVMLRILYLVPGICILLLLL